MKRDKFILKKNKIFQNFNTKRFNIWKYFFVQKESKIHIPNLKKIKSGNVMENTFKKP